MAEAVVDARLLELATDAGRHVGLYRRLWAGSRPGTAFRQLPRLDKALLRACSANDRIHDLKRHQRLTTELSSGSSGQPLTVYTDRRARRARSWAFLRALWVSGYRPGQRCLMLTSRRDAGWLAAARWHYAGIGEDTEAIARRLDKLRPAVLYGPLSILELLAERREELRQTAPGVTLVISTAEQLTGRRRATLERAFAAPVADFYGMSEFGLVAYRPPGSSHYRPARSSLLLEYIAVPGDPAIEQLVVTDLAERTSPLIRYDTGDIVRRDLDRAGRPILEFAGRSFDSLVQPDGERISPFRIDVALEQLPGLAAFEVVQQADLSIDVTVETAAGDAVRLCSAVAQKLESVLGSRLTLRITAGAIGRGPPGAKFRPIRSRAGGGA
ncbi:MAG: hypothetical protein ACREVI_02330 [Steroidobacteraceae bacterium]